MQRVLSSPCRRGAVGRRLLILSVILPLLSLASAALAQTTPKALLPLDGDPHSKALAINNRGETAGISGTGLTFDDGSTAVVWDRKGRPRALLPLPGDLHSHAAAINNRGEVAGHSGTFDGPFDWTAVRWDRKGVAMALPPLPGDDRSAAMGINAAGEVVGASSIGDKITAVIWDLDGIPRALPGGSIGRAINNQGMVAGQSGDRPVVWSRNGTRRILSLLTEDDGQGLFHYQFEANGINWRGEVVGTNTDADGYVTAVIWDRNGEPRALELPLLETYPGEFEIFDTSGFGIDPTGEVVGNSSYGLAMLWDRSGTVMVLPPLESDEISYAYAINNRGEIAGYSEGYDSALGQETITAAVWR